VNGWIWALVVYLVISIVLTPVGIGERRTVVTAIESITSALLILWAILHLGHVL
jgi:hypothetical protein